MERDSFVFYRSFAEALADLDENTRVHCYDAITQYALNGEIVELTGIESAVFKLIKPQLDANNKRFENGLKGGRPKQNQTITKIKPKQNQNKTNPKPNVNVNVNVNDNVNDNDINTHINYQNIIDLYNNICKSFPKVTRITDKRKKTLKARLKAYTIDDLKKVFEMAEQSDFLKGVNGGWSASFDWLINENNMVKVLDGNYANRNSSKIDMDAGFRDFLEGNQVVDWG